ncbi:hypothetical protein HPP92_016056 [Vanilla planifolia]|uniref:Uncharacterized protein n=1 Tax=Vanilla planifolia TaxID=51239 RepID=A0A835QG51_VANPL|nr:hypothetical protein HPP92_016665 [Vanilla planifolia]KAG0471510.1 hypothetical protein HPP92_016056 [Vanilla planifolia]
MSSDVAAIGVKKGDNFRCTLGTTTTNGRPSRWASGPASSSNVASVNFDTERSRQFFPSHEIPSTFRRSNRRLRRFRRVYGDPAKAQLPGKGAGELELRMVGILL